MLMSIVRADLVCVAWVCLTGCGRHASVGAARRGHDAIVGTDEGCFTLGTM